MAIEANTYGLVKRVESFVGDLVEGRNFSATTVPNISQMEAFLDDIAHEINMELKQVGYKVPVVKADDPEAFDFLRTINSYGGALLAMSSLPAEAAIIVDQETLSNRATTYNSFFQRGLKRIREQDLPAARDVRTLSRIFAGSQEDDEGNVNKPMFTRDLFDYPSSRSLTE